MLVVSWNIKAIKTASTEHIEAVCRYLGKVEPELVLLQEVGEKLHPSLIAELERRGFHAFYGGVAPGSAKPYSNIIASRGAVSGEAPGWADVPWPQLLTRASVDFGGHPVDVVVAHVPNGSANGWNKVRTFEGLKAVLDSAPKAPRILGGDFNEPERFIDAENLWSFGARRTRNGEYSLEGNYTAPKQPAKVPRETDSRRRWQSAVEDVLARKAQHGLRHAYFEAARMEDAAPVTYEVKVRNGKKKPRFFDHLLVSSHFHVEDAGFFDDWRTDGTSDHSAAWARVRLQ